MLGKAFEMLIPIGVLMLAAGGVLLWLGRRAASKSAPLVAPRSHQPRPVATGGYAAIGGTPVVCTPTELEPASRIEPVFPSPRQAPVTWGAEVFEVIEWRRFEGGDGSPVLDVLFENGCDSSGHDWR